MLLRALHIMASGARGGGADHLVGLLPELAELGWDVRAAVGTDGPLVQRLQAAGIPATPIELMRRRLDPGAPGRIAQLTGELQPDVLHLHGTRAAFFAGLARVRPTPMPPLIYTAHGLAFRQQLGLTGTMSFHLAEAVACRAAAHVISVSRTDLTELERRRYVASHAGSHIANAVDVSRFAGKDRSAARQRLGLAADVFVVGTVSRLVPQKAVGDLLQAMQGVQAAQLVVIGDGPLRGELERQARSLASPVHFVGARDDVPELVAAFDLFALSSRWEGEPIALLEALAAGLPIVATATEGACEILAHSEAGQLVDVGAPQAMAAAIESLQHDAERRRRMAAAAVAVVEGRTWARAAQGVDAVYRRLTGT